MIETITDEEANRDLKIKDILRFSSNVPHALKYQGRNNFNGSRQRKKIKFDRVIFINYFY